jgi:hypothetical protein
MSMQTKKTKFRVATWVLAGIVGGSVPMIAPLPVRAADEATDVAADKVPPAVAAAVRTEAPDGTDVVYSKMGGEDHYRVGVTVPTGIRLRLALKGDGTALHPAELAENQPKTAPKDKATRERLLAEYGQRAVTARAAAVVVQPPIAPPVPPAAPIPVAPPPVVAAPATPAAPAAPTVPGNPPEVNGVRAAVVTLADLPPAARQTLEPLAGKDKNAVYSKQVRDGNKVYYGAEYRENGKEMWVRVNEAGKTVAGPVLAEAGKAADNDARPAAGKVAGGVSDAAAGAAKLADLPKPVAATVAQHTMGGKNVQTTKYTEDGKPAYRVSWADAQGDKHEMRVDADGKQIVDKPAGKSPAPKK